MSLIGDVMQAVREQDGAAADKLANDKRLVDGMMLITPAQHSALLKSCNTFNDTQGFRDVLNPFTHSVQAATGPTIEIKVVPTDGRPHVINDNWVAVAFPDDTIYVIRRTPETNEFLRDPSQL